MGGLCVKAEDNSSEPLSRDEASTEEMALFSKTININDFKIEKVVGRGSFGKVFMVKKKDDGQVLAMKVLKKEAIEARNQRIHTKCTKLSNYFESVLAEREILEKVKCPFIVNLHYAFQTPDKLYFVMDFLNGGELFFHLRKEIRFTEKRTRFYAGEILVALETLHKSNIIYRDLKPENVLLGSDGHIKITDFGLSKVGLEYGDKKAYTFCGTPEYLAPEIIKRAGHDKAVDWWSLGALVYEMLSGRPPFWSRNRQQMLKNIIEKQVEMKSYFSEDASSLLQGLLTQNPTERLGGGVEDAEEIKRHPFFKNLNFELLEKKEIEPPFKPKTKGEDDYKNIDQMFLRETVQDTPVVSKLNLEQKRDNMYDGFTYAQKPFHNNQSDL